MPVFPFATNNTALQHKLPLHSISIQFIFIIGQQTSIKAYREQKAHQLIWSYLLSAYISPVGRWLHRSIRVQVGCHINRAGPLASPSTWTRVCSRRRYRTDRFHRLSLDSQKKKEKRNSSLTMANLDRVRSHWEPVPKHDHVFGHPYGNRHVDFFNDYNDANAPFTVYSSTILRWVGRSTLWKNAIRWIPERGVAKTSLLAEMQSNRPEFVVDWTMSDGGTVNWITTYYTATCHRVENTLDGGPSWRPPLLKVLIHF